MRLKDHTSQNRVGQNLSRQTPALPKEGSRTLGSKLPECLR